MPSASILILEHISTLARVYSLALQGLGYSVKTLTDGRLVLEYLHTHTPEVIICDCQTLGPSSTELLSYLKSQRRFRQTKIIALANDLQADTPAHTQADYLLPKPIDLSALSTLISELTQPRPWSLSFNTATT